MKCFPRGQRGSTADAPRYALHILALRVSPAPSRALIFGWPRWHYEEKVCQLRTEKKEPKLGTFAKVCPFE